MTRSAVRTNALSAISLLFLLLPACSRSDRPEKNEVADRYAIFEQQCQSYIRGRLINPETVQFFEFEHVSSREYAQLMIDAATRGQNVSPEVRARTRQQVEAMTDELVTDLTNAGAELFRYRVKAEARLGNLVTSYQLCAVTARDCSCLSEENFRTGTPP